MDADRWAAARDDPNILFNDAPRRRPVRTLTGYVHAQSYEGVSLGEGRGHPATDLANWVVEACGAEWDRWTGTDQDVRIRLTVEIIAPDAPSEGWDTGT